DQYDRTTAARPPGNHRDRAAAERQDVLVAQYGSRAARQPEWRAPCSGYGRCVGACLAKECEAVDSFAPKTPEAARIRDRTGQKSEVVQFQNSIQKFARVIPRGGRPVLVNYMRGRHKHRRPALLPGA